MKCCIVLVLALIGLSLADTDHTGGRGCIYVDGKCSESCPDGTHAYTTGCNYLLPEATCAEPNPVLDKRGKICDYSSCYCDEPTVKDTKTNLCVTVDKCT